MSNFQSNKTDGSESLFGEIIFSYTRAQAIADRVLIDVTPTALETGFRFPTAVTGDLMAAIETMFQAQDLRRAAHAIGGAVPRGPPAGRIPGASHAVRPP